MHQFTWNVVMLKGCVVRTVVVVYAYTKDDAAEMARKEVVEKFGECDYMMACVNIA